MKRAMFLGSQTGCGAAARTFQSAAMLERSQPFSNPDIPPASNVAADWKVRARRSVHGRKAGVLFVCLLLSAFAARSATFTATLDRDTVGVGESATLSLTFEGGNPESMADFEIANVRIEARGTSQNFSLVNGKANSS